jgi:hypothetical protein
MRKVLGWMLAPVLAVSVGASAQTPREQFAKMLDVLQQTPKDDALRESIVRLGQQLKPAPAIPEEARRDLVQGNTALEDATGVEDYARAAKYYQDALALAPWWGAAYLSLARAQELQFDYGSAQRNLKLYMLTAAGSPDDARKAQDYMYALQEKQDHTDKTQAEYDSKFGWLSGKWNVTRKFIDPSGYAVVETDPLTIRTLDEGSRVMLKIDGTATEHNHRKGGDQAAPIHLQDSLRVSYDSSGQLVMEIFEVSDRQTCAAERGWNDVQFELGGGRQTFTVTRDELYPPPQCEPSGYSTVWVFERAS